MPLNDVGRFEQERDVAPHEESVIRDGGGPSVVSAGGRDDRGRSADPRSEARAPRLAVKCRRIAPADRDALANLLAAGFPIRGLAYWGRALDRLLAHVARENLPQAGYVLEAGGAPVGVLLTIVRRMPETPERLVCNLSSWYVEDAFRAYGSMLVSAATRDRSVTYVNVSPERHTRATIEAQGFVRYSAGLFVGAPLLARRPRGSVRLVDGDAPPQDVAVSPDERDLVAAHAGYACVALWIAVDGRALPFVFAPRRLYGRIPSAHLVYCGDPADVARFARPIGRALARRGVLVLTLDANGPIPGLPGRYLADRMPKYVRGPVQPRLGDLAFTEIAMFGL